MIKIKKESSFRPTSSKVKEALFEILGSLNECFILDLFGGSGSIAFEALKRGAKGAVVVEKDIKRYKNIVAASQKLESNKLEIYNNCAFRALKILAKRGRKFNFIFIDPPYEKGLALKVLESSELGTILSDGGLLVVEHSKREMRWECGKILGNLELSKVKEYGGTILSFFRIK